MERFLRSIAGLACAALVGCTPSPAPCTGAACTDGGGSDAPATTDSGAGTDAGGGTDSGGGGVPGGTVRVTITRTAGLTFSGDGSGELFIDVGGMCPYSGGIDVLMTTMHGTVDMTSPSFSMTYDITGVPAGSYQIWAWIDDNADGMPFPNGGDAGNFPTCGTATVSATAGAEVALVFESSSWN